MKKSVIFLIALVALVSSMLSTFLEGKINNNYISLISVTFGLGVALIFRYVNAKQKK
ncbi:hypothetical protein [Bacillus sp. AFS041924]|uniref:hypothetical protein n=1 Tax=Bacillus sp. AFS041924 TaxID=2033503 RepID=UPI00159BE062|nr:hypothetical protein [Bacillus sp. AFS041924]